MLLRPSPSCGNDPARHVPVAGVARPDYPNQRNAAAAAVRSRNGLLVRVRAHRSVLDLFRDDCGRLFACIMPGIRGRQGGKSYDLLIYRLDALQDLIRDKRYEVLRLEPGASAGSQDGVLPS